MKAQLKITHPTTMTKAMLRPNEVGAYLDGVRPSMSEIECTMRVEAVGYEKYLLVIAKDIDECLICVQFANGKNKWIRVESVEYIHPY